MLLRVHRSLRSAITVSRTNYCTGARNLNRQPVHAAVWFVVARIKTEPVLMAQLFGNQVERIFEVCDFARIETTCRNFRKLVSRTLPHPHSFAPCARVAFASQAFAEADRTPRRACANRRAFCQGNGLAADRQMLDQGQCRKRSNNQSRRIQPQSRAIRIH